MLNSKHKLFYPFPGYTPKKVNVNATLVSKVVDRKRETFHRIKSIFCEHSYKKLYSNNYCPSLQRAPKEQTNIFNVVYIL